MNNPSLSLIPAKAGIQFRAVRQKAKCVMDPAFQRDERVGYAA